MQHGPCIGHESSPIQGLDSTNNIKNKSLNNSFRTGQQINSLFLPK